MRVICKISMEVEFVFLNKSRLHLFRGDLLELIFVIPVTRETTGVNDRVDPWLYLHGNFS